MKEIVSQKHIIRLCMKYLEYCDPRLVNHGERVAYIACQIWRCLENKEEINIKELLLLSLFHDIGAYKTEEIDRMVQFESTDVHRHTVYGYLFLKYFTPLKQFAEGVLYHHTPHSALELNDSPMRAYAELIHLADRVDVAMMHQIPQGTLLEKLKKQDFNPRCLKALETALEHCDFYQDLDTGIAQNWVFQRVEHLEISQNEALKYLKMLIHIIDFKSEDTVLHSINTAVISLFLAYKLELSKEEIDRIYFAALVHDMGKVAIPDDILNCPGRLDAEQMKIMRRHVEYTEEIIQDILPPDIVRIAARHHEKLNGSGYPRGLDGSQMSVSDRIVAVADIVSALSSRRSYKESYQWDKVIDILSDMAENHLIDQEITAVIVNQHDLLQEVMERQAAPVKESYEKIKREYRELMSQWEDQYPAS